VSAAGCRPPPSSPRLNPFQDPHEPVPFFIDRPIFAGVLSVLIFLAGLIAMRGLPISEYPEVAPSVVVRAQYPAPTPR
jgi:multidrug efflux pump subunit AcrB